MAHALRYLCVSVGLQTVVRLEIVEQRTAVEWSQLLSIELQFSAFSSNRWFIFKVIIFLF